MEKYTKIKWFATSCFTKPGAVCIEYSNKKSHRVIGGVLIYIIYRGELVYID